MEIQSVLKGMLRVLVLGIAVLGIALPLAGSTPTEPLRRLFPREFSEAAPQGFGDRQNSAAWSMQWWNGKLYVGTVRAWYCWVQAWAHTVAPFIAYPPDDPDTDCAPDPRDLALQAEIWRYTPETETWERVYQSPNDVEMPGHPGRYTARDAGYRDMVVFEEPDGTEALYVCGATVNALWPLMPPPRILRSTDGITFEPIPHDPGTILGDLGQDQATFRDFEIYNGRLYVINGRIRGHGAVLEAEDPAGGNDNFRWITPQGMKVFEMAPFNGFLYLGIADPWDGYSVVKTDATGTLPYTLTPVVTNGGFLEPLPSDSVVSMHVFQDRLYVGMDKPAELIRINPDDTWDLVVGKPRETPDGWKYPFSGMDAGFDWPLNVHMWRMQEHEGVLYVGTADESTQWGRIPGLDELISWQYGFDLYLSTDGHYFTPITITGFGDKFQMGLRTFASTPHGLFLGTVSFWYGLRIWQGIPGEMFTMYLPLVVKSSGGPGVAQGSGTSPSVVSGLSPGTRFLKPPERLEVGGKDGTVVLSWEPSPRATRFRIFRSDSTSNRQLQIPDLDPDTWVPGPFAEIGTTDQFFFVDTTVPASRPAHYYVLAEDAAGSVSQPSNLVRAPSLAPPVTFESLQDWTANLGDPGKPSFQSTTGEIASVLDAGNLDRALQRLMRLRQNVQRGQIAALEPWQAEDLEILLAKLARRVRLAQAGIISPSDLN